MERGGCMHAKPGQRWQTWLPLIFLVVLAGCSSGGTSMSHSTATWVATANAALPPLKSFPNANALDSYLNQQVAKGVLSGSVLVAQNDMLFSKGYNLAD